MGDITIKVDGLKELERSLRDFPVVVQRRIIARSVYAGAAIVRDAARDRVQRVSGKTAKSIVLKKGRSRRGDIETRYRVIVKSPVGHLLELGTSAHRIPKAVTKGQTFKTLYYNGKFRKWTVHPGSKRFPFLRPAFDACVNSVTTTIGQVS